ncbi:hypothetical protein GCM10011583_51510 [Streptomyces camponoticapitis]|uniref:OmpR/PhoB-type domain-containing protein n=1 Tax=Streptomyces camponoticapitis TaxID=1616125 RepID=A0ABQ2EL21_9ACTN|nr:BTAD domain-containing putative transcriptional regulator [Streptomyces camponoticapitis]GGK13247.1 hypothetical protein GCM10011583_51510 [Streptomyces camponoticapitis]
MDRDSGPRVPEQRARATPNTTTNTAMDSTTGDIASGTRKSAPGPVSVADSAPEETTPTPGTELRFGVLGPVRAWRGGEPLPSGSPQQRALLAALLLREGRTATAGELIDAIWGESAPSQALAAVRTYASRLRKVLSPGVLVSESGGYALHTGPDALDLSVAQELSAAAEKERTAGNRQQARVLINKALGLWDGEPLASVPGPYAETERARLDEWRLQLVETRLDIDLELGRHAEAVSELTALTAAHPLRERLRELLMLALYRSGRQAEALAVYADTRRLLADELGVDPRPELARLQHRILQADAELARPVEETAPVVTFTRPAQLPATVPDFTGRELFVRELGRRLASAEGSVMAVSALAGIGGVGKTTLAVHVAHAARPRFPDGQLYVDLQGAGARFAEPEAVLGSFLRALGTPDSAIPDSLDERSALYRSALDGRRVLVLLDNARDAAQVRPLLPGTEGCAALVTSRVRMVDLEGAHLVDLDVMSPEEALQLFTRIVGEERVSSEREAALDVVAAVLDLPPHETEDLLESLVDTSLVESAAPGRYRYHDLVRLYARACADRDEQPPTGIDLALFRLLDFYLATAARVYTIERPGDRLKDHLEPTEYEGLVFTDRHEAQDWLYAEADCLLACARQAAGGARLRVAVDLLWAAQDLAESGANSKSYETAARSALAAAREAGDARTEGRARTSMTNVHLVAGRYEEADEEARQAAALAESVQDPAPVYWSDNDRGIIALGQGRFKDAEAHLLKAMEGSRADGNRPGEASALCNLSRIQHSLGRTSRAIALAEQGVQVYDSIGHTLRLSNARFALGIALTHAGRHKEALEQLAQALEGFETNRQRLWEGTTHFRIAQAHLAARRAASAAQHAEQALAIGCIGGDRTRANVLITLGKALENLGQADRARVCWREALALHEESGAAEAEEVRELLDAPLSAA